MRDKVRRALETFAHAAIKPVTSAVVIILGCYTVLWGFWVANPFWSVFEQAPLYQELAQLAPELFWGLLAMFCGAITIWGALRRSYRALNTGAIIAGWHWTMIAIFYLLGDWQNTGGITAGALAVYAAFVYLNIKINHKNLGKDMEELLPRQ